MALSHVRVPKAIIMDAQLCCTCLVLDLLCLFHKLRRVLGSTEDNRISLVYVGNRTGMRLGYRPNLLVLLDRLCLCILMELLIVR